MIIVIAFSLGCISGWMFYSVDKIRGQREHDKQMDFIMEENRRLQRQVADTIGRGPYG